MPTIDRIKISQEINFNGMPTWIGLEGTLLPDENEKDGLRHLQKSITRYQQAHELDFKTKYSQAYENGHYFKPKMPDCNKANGLTNAIINFIIWNGYRATRVSSSGRMIAGKYIPGTTRRGAADISSTIKGRSVMWEIKVGNDKPSPEQLREQELERKAGGEYFFIHSFDEFIFEWDKIM